MFIIIVSAVICFVTVPRSISGRGRGGEFDETNLQQQGRGQVLLELAELVQYTIYYAGCVALRGVSMELFLGNQQRVLSTSTYMLSNSINADNSNIIMIN